MNESIYNGQRIKIQLSSIDDDNVNTGVNLTLATTLKIKVKVAGSTTENTATVVGGDNYSCYINYNVTAVGRHTVWIHAVISGTEKYIGRPFEFDVLAEGIV